MNDSDVQELKRLRARAFSRDADIDAAGLQRLRELEARVAAITPPPRTPTRPAPPVPDAATAASTPHVPPRPPIPGAPAPASTIRSPTRFAELIRSPRVLVIAAAAAVVIALVAATVSITTALGGPRQVATLASLPDEEWDEQFYGPQGPGSMMFEPFHGLTVVLVTDPWGAQAEVPCLFVAQNGGQTHMLTAGCGTDHFAPTTAVEVSEGMVEELLEQFPVGSELQFVLGDDEVHVYAAG